MHDGSAVVVDMLQRLIAIFMRDLEVKQNQMDLCTRAIFYQLHKLPACGASIDIVYANINPQHINDQR